MGKELTRIEIPLYIRTVTMSESRQKKFYIKGEKELPKKYTDTTKYTYKKKGIKYVLYNNIDQEFVVANPKAQGTPKVELINGQAIYNGYIAKWSRAKMMNTIKISFQPFINNMIPINEYPLKIIMEIHDLVSDPLCKGQLWDLGNRAFTYMKKFEDCLSGNKLYGRPTTKQIIDDDNVTKIIGLEYKFIPISNNETRKLVFIIEKV